MKLRFTKEIKDNRLKALKSGEYIRHTGTLKGPSLDEYCCIGVLGQIHPNLKPTAFGKEDENPYSFLINTVGKKNNDELHKANDSVPESLDKGYSCVIPLIEKLPVTK